jgi:5'-nucleotidase
MAKVHPCCAKSPGAALLFYPWRYLGFVILACALAWQLPSSAALGLPAVPAKMQVAISYTGNGLGEIEPCGCANKPMGGLARRAQAWQDRQRMRNHPLLLDTGASLTVGEEGLAERPGEAVARGELLMQTMGYMGYAGVHVAAADLALGLERLRKLSKAQRVPLLSANLMQGAKPAFLPSLVKQRGPLKIGVFGLSPLKPAGARWLKAAGLTVADPTQAARQAVADLRGQGCDLVVLLSQLRRADAQKLVLQVAGIDLVLGSSAMEMATDLEEMGPALYADADQKGRSLAEVLVQVRGRRDRYYPGEKRGSLAREHKDLREQLAKLQQQLAAPSTPADKRAVLEKQLVAKRAKLQRLSLELQADALPADASTVTLSVIGLEVGLADEPGVAEWVAAYQKKFPKRDAGK